MWITFAFGGSAILWLMVLFASVLGRMIHLGHPIAETEECTETCRPLRTGTVPSGRRSAVAEANPAKSGALGIGGFFPGD
jgi:hypothetical protein